MRFNDSGSVNESSVDIKMMTDAVNEKRIRYSVIVDVKSGLLLSARL